MMKQIPCILMAALCCGLASAQELRCTSAGDPVGYVFLVDYEHNTAKLLKPSNSASRSVSVSGVELKVTSDLGDDNFTFDAMRKGQAIEKFIIVRKDLSFTDTPLQSSFPIALNHMGRCIVAQAPDDPAHIYFKSGYAKGARDIDGAIADFTKAIEANPKYAEAYYYRGLARHAKRDLDGAIADFTKAVELKPDFADAKARLQATRSQ
jgi:tetratricopeptide (TPR) repeat protein